MEIALKLGRWLMLFACNYSYNIPSYHCKPNCHFHQLKRYYQILPCASECEYEITFLSLIAIVTITLHCFEICDVITVFLPLCIEIEIIHNSEAFKTLPHNSTLFVQLRFLFFYYCVDSEIPFSNCMGDDSMSSMVTPHMSSGTVNYKNITVILRSKKPIFRYKKQNKILSKNGRTKAFVPCACIIFTYSLSDKRQR